MKVWEWPRSPSKFSMDLGVILQRAGLREANVRQSRLWTLREATVRDESADPAAENVRGFSWA